MKSISKMDNLRTDLVLEKDINLENSSKIEEYNSIKVIDSRQKKYHFTTIFFDDITDKKNYEEVLTVFIKQLKKYLMIEKEDIILVVGLGNEDSTPDSLGPKTIENILVTRYLYLFGEVEGNYSNVCSFVPNVMGNTGIETTDIIKSIIKETHATKVIIVDALKTNHIDRLTKTIQITDQGIAPGSGVQGKRKEISKETMNIDIIAIGVPTVVDIETILENYTKKNYFLKENLIVTPTNIDFIIEKLAFLISDSINISLHKDFKRQNNSL